MQPSYNLLITNASGNSYEFNFYCLLSPNL